MGRGPGTDPPVRMISSPADLQELAGRLERESEVAFDTEFHGERTYWPRLMLVQIATANEVCLVDPLAPGMSDATSGLFAFLAERRTVIVGHDVRSDLEIFYRVSGRLPCLVFDTQIAASFVGMGQSIGLGNLVSCLAGIELPKGHTLADWSRRPLPPDQMAYAANDVRHLPAVSSALRRRIEEAGRSGWVEEECALLLDPASFEPADPAKELVAVRRRPAAGTRACVLVDALAVERENLARKLDRRPRHLLPDDVMVDLARRAPTSRSELVGRTNRRRPQGLTQYGDTWLKAIRDGLKLPLPEPPTARRPHGEADQAFMGLVRLFVHDRMQELGLAPALVMSRVLAGIEENYRNPPTGQEAFIEALGLSGWRREILAEQLWAMFQGRLVPAIRHGEAGPSVTWETKGTTLPGR